MLSINLIVAYTGHKFNLAKSICVQGTSDQCGNTNLPFPDSERNTTSCVCAEVGCAEEAETSGSLEKGRSQTADDAKPRSIEEHATGKRINEAEVVLARKHVA